MDSKEVLDKVIDLSFLYSNNTFIIAEAGVNHCGKLALGKKLCLAAKKVGLTM